MPSKDKCRNEGCGAYESTLGLNCGLYVMTVITNNSEWEIDKCRNFTTTPTVSITKERLAELEGEIKARDSRFRACCEHGGNCAEPPPEYCPQCVCMDRLALASQENINKDLIEQCRSFHGQIAELEADKERLDWLVENVNFFQTVGDRIDICTAKGCDCGANCAITIREAIDKARVE